jgi:putative DNA primase/helicase
MSTNCPERVPINFDGMTVAEAAALWAQHGWLVFPVRAADKMPLVKWRADAARLPRTPNGVFHLFKRMEAKGALMIGCAVPPGIVVCDFDHKPDKGWDAAKHLSAMVQTFYLAPGCTSVSCSPGGGFHAWFKLPDGLVSNNWDARTGGFPIPGTDGRGDGGYVNVPPSIRADGKAYRWLAPPQPIIGPAPDALIKFVTSRAKRLARADHTTIRIDGHTSTYWRVATQSMDRLSAQRMYDQNLVRAANAGEGGRNNQLFTSAVVVGRLVSSGFVSLEQAARDLDAAAARSGYAATDPRGVAPTIRSGIKKGQERGPFNIRDEP